MNKKLNFTGNFRIRLDHVITGQDKAEVTAAVVRALIRETCVAELRIQRHEFTVFCSVAEDDFSPQGLRMMAERLEKLAEDARDAALSKQSKAKEDFRVNFTIQQNLGDAIQVVVLEVLAEGTKALAERAYKDQIFGALAWEQRTREDASKLLITSEQQSLHYGLSYVNPTTGLYELTPEDVLRIQSIMHHNDIPAIRCRMCGSGFYQINPDARDAEGNFQVDDCCQDCSHPGTVKQIWAWKPPMPLEPRYAKPEMATEFICSGKEVDVWFVQCGGQPVKDRVLVVTEDGPVGTWNRDSLQHAISCNLPSEGGWCATALAALNARYPL